MKQLSLLLIAIVAVWGLSSCDNAKLGEMKAKQERMVDSLANVQIEDIKTQLMEDCNASVEEMIQTKVDSVQAIMASGGGGGADKPKGTAKPTSTTPPAVTPPKSKPTLKDRRRSTNVPSGSGTMTNPDGSEVVPSTRGGKTLKDRRRKSNN